MRTLAIIPARSGSKRVENKNIRNFCGKPLLGWTVQFANSYPRFDHVHVSTDAEEIAQVALDHGVAVPFLRSAENATDHASTLDVVLECLDRLTEIGKNFDLVAILQPTTPYRNPDRWDEAFEMMEGTEFDAVFSARPCESHPWHAFALSEVQEVDFFFDLEKRTARSQDLPLAFAFNGSLYLIRAEGLRQSRTLTSGTCGAVICDKTIENLDIDTEADWDMAERICEGVLRH